MQWKYMVVALLGLLGVELFAEPLSQRIANYQIDARLDVANRKIYGKEVIRWINTTQAPAQDLQFHLYWNAWQHDRTSWLSSTRYSERAKEPRTPDDWGYTRVTAIQLQSPFSINLTNTQEFIQPDDGNPLDQTVLRVALSQPVLPGDTAVITIEWEAKVPRPFARTGVVGNYYFIAQWFPKIGVFQEDGTWNCHQFIQTEFFADYGVYDVKLTVPTGWIVGATGVEKNRTDNGDGTTTHHYYQEDVHDFVWTTSPDFLEFTDEFRDPNLPPVTIRLLLQPYNRDKKDRYLEATKIALRYYGSWFGAYPYGHLTVVDPAYQSRSGGMEYPTLFTGGTPLFSKPLTRQPESVTIHECGHQFWYGIVGNNEFEDAWLDEGFNTYSQAKVMDEALPDPVEFRYYFEGYFPWIFKDIPSTERYDGADKYSGFHSPFKLDRMDRPSYQQGPGAYRINAYYKPLLTLRTLENYLGWPTFRKIMATYFERWKFRHPTPEDFFQVVNEVSGQQLDWFWEQTYHSSNIFDYAVDQVITMSAAPSKGVVPVEQTVVPVDQASEFLKANYADLWGKKRNLVYVRRWGEATFPVTVKVTFANGDTVLEHWDGKDRWKRWEYIHPAEVVRVEVDPQRVLVLDVSVTNNSWDQQAPTTAAARKWATRWLLWLQHLLQFLAFFS